MASFQDKIKFYVYYSIGKFRKILKENPQLQNLGTHDWTVDRIDNKYIIEGGNIKSGILFIHLFYEIAKSKV